MELGLSLGDASKPFEFNSLKQKKKKKRGLCMALGINSHKLEEENDVDESSDDYLNLLPLPHSLSSDNGSWENGSSGNMEASSANSVGSMDLGGIYLRNHVVANDVVEDENGLNHTKKLRLSKQQSASLEESFKENNSINPKEKVALAKQLNLRPRQVEVWFQNRRARTKLKQTEVDCEYLKRCTETLTEENRRLHKELEELRALKSNPFHMQLPATTLTMCPACQRLATAQTSIPFSQIPSQPNHT